MSDVLIINSYAGSLVLGAKAAGLPIRRSMEDSGYGIAAQKLNFPDLKYVDKHPWPTDDLSDTIGIAHPPCAAFSNMNIVASKKGTDTDAFECHRKVLDYCLGQGIKALAIESVTGALKFAAHEYTAYANKYGYQHCFVLLNSCGFGVPQWRPRVWMLFFKNLEAPMRFWYHPKYVAVGSVLNHEKATDHVTLKHVEYLAKKYAKAKFPFEEMMASDRVEPGGFDKLVRQFVNLGIDGPGAEFTDWTGTKWTDIDSDDLKEISGTKGLYRAGLPRKLDLTMPAPVILGFTLWYENDRPLNQVEYNRIMGFPDDYKWPMKEGKDFLTYLSKGVCPPVATWILQQMVRNLEEPLAADFTHSCVDGQVVDLQPQKADVQEVLRTGGEPRYQEVTVYDVTARAVPATNGFYRPESRPDPCCVEDTPGSASDKPYYAAQIKMSRRPQDGDLFQWSEESRGLTLVSPITSKIPLGASLTPRINILGLTPKKVAKASPSPTVAHHTSPVEVVEETLEAKKARWER